MEWQPTKGILKKLPKWNEPGDGRKLNPPSGSEESESLLSSPFLELISSGAVVAHLSSRFFFGRPIWLAAKKFVATVSLRRRDGARV
ncbi:unnamed protein product [Linum trigynum]|uniref:Uncharacterized protein n=1 Tax=Linum trigynum TaxID=586398 RepID=A0AAV2EWQ5_9ROSI